MTNFTHRKSRDIGDILTDTFQYVRIHYITLGKNLLFFVLPFYLVYSFIMKDYASNFFANFLTPDSLGNLSSFFGWRYFTGIALALFASMMLSVVTIKHIALTDEGIEPSPANILNGITPLIFRYMGLFSLLFLILAFSSLFFLVPAIFLGIKLSLAPASLVIGKHGVDDAMGESWQLTKEYWWSTFGLFIMMYVITIFATYVVVMPATILSIFTIESGTITDVSTFSLIINTFMAISTAISSLFTAILHISFALQYYNLMERKEGGSLRSKIESLAD